LPTDIKLGFPIVWFVDATNVGISGMSNGTLYEILKGLPNVIPAN
jgi:hypothetical protein